MASDKFGCETACVASSGTRDGSESMDVDVLRYRNEFKTPKIEEIKILRLDRTVHCDLEHR